MNGDTVYQVVTKLIGPIHPLGSTGADDNRLDNLREIRMDNLQTWKTIDSIPKNNQLVIVYNTFSGYALRSFNANGEPYDENEFYDDSKIEWDMWAEIPDRLIKLNDTREK